MESITLEDVIKEEIKNLLNGKVDKRITTFVDYQNKYAVLSPSVKVEVELKRGIKATIDISDFFKEELK